VTDAGVPPAPVGLYTGPVVFQEGDYFGRTVNIAARIADYARPGEVLVSQEVVEASDGAGVTYREIGPVELKVWPGFCASTRPIVSDRSGASRGSGIDAGGADRGCACQG